MWGEREMKPFISEDKHWNLEGWEEKQLTDDDTPEALTLLQDIY